MMHADANVVISAAKYHIGSRNTGLVGASSGRFLGHRKELKISLCETVVGEVLAGVKSVEEQAMICSYLRRLRLVTLSDSVIRLAARLRNLYKERVASEFSKDALAYVAAAEDKAEFFVTWDSGFVGKDNRIKIKNSAKMAKLSSIPSVLTPAEALANMKTNPVAKKEASINKAAFRVIAAHRARASKLAAKYVGDDPIEQAKFFVGVARSFGFWFTK